MIWAELLFIIVIGFFALYLSFLTTLAFFKSTHKTKTASKHHRIAVVVPAHDEEIGIENTVKNLLAIEYPKESFEVIVVADNCTDNTAACAAGIGAKVLERKNPELLGKGYALRWCFELLSNSPEPYDAYLVIDADSEVSKNILEVINIYLNEGAEVLQCADLVKPQPGAWSSEITRIGLALYNYVKPLGRKVIGFTAGLRGNGMCFTTKLLAKIPWQAFSQTEDLEYGLVLLLNGVVVTFVPEAKVLALMPTDPKNAESQRERWEVGRFPLIKKYGGLLFTSALKKASMKIMDAFIELVTPAFVNLFAFTILMLFINAILLVFGVSDASTLLIIWGILFVLLLYHVIGGLYISGADKNTFLTLLNAPRFIIWKMLLYLKIASKGHTKYWVRTARETQKS